MTTALRKGSTGPAVKELQLQLAALGYDIGRWGADGALGRDTLAAVRDFEEDRGLAVTDAEIPAATIAAIAQAYARRDTVPKPAGFVDLTAAHAGIHRRGVRPWSQVTGITLHQTAVRMGERPERWVKWPVKDDRGNVYDSSLKAHVAVTGQGQILLCNPLNAFVWHAQQLSKTDIGIEIDGSFEGVEGRRDTWWQPPGMKDPMQPPALQLQRAVAAVLWIACEVERQGGKIRYLHAHRQSSEDRRGDPGSRIWKDVALPMIQRLGLSDGGPGWKIGSGAPIPAEWNPQYTAVKY